ncbi:MAG: UvrD-helicase domain-containing protein [Christensenellaceae bacterium]
MAAFVLTEKQKEAIEAREKNILVSAAAGSGKTSVLAKRVAALVAEGADVRRMLVVTFTNAAALEMRLRIRRELEEHAEETGKYAMREQAEAVSAADINTIHNFGAKMIRENFSLLGLSADVAVLSEERGTLLRAEVMEAVIAALYAEQNEAFLLLRDRYGGRTDDGLVDALFSIYRFAKSREEGLHWLREVQKNDAEKYMQVAQEICETELVKLKQAMQACLALEAHYEITEKQQENNLEDLEMAETLAALFKTDEDKYAVFLQNAKVKNMARNAAEEPIKERLSTQKKAGRETLKKLKAFLPQTISTRIAEELPYMHDVMDTIYMILTRFEAMYTAEKKAASVIDFDDMVSMPLELLQKEDIRAAYSARYDYIFIDEYQDTNPAQEAMLFAITPRGGHFMVGDMKQSIYRFRMADPTIFKEKMLRFAAEPDARLVHMNENFRSSPAVIDTVNHSMRHLMSEALGDIAYTENEALQAKIDTPGGVEFLLTAYEKKNAEEYDKNRQEAHTIAQRILALLEERKEDGSINYHPEDICVLLRNTAGNLRLMAREFERYGIPVEVPMREGNTEPEIEVFVNLLRVINGAYSDIALLSVLKSHIGGFTEPELACIRNHSDKKITFWAALFQYAQEENALGEKCAAILAQIELQRTYMRGLLLEDLLLQIKQETNYETFLAAQENGSMKRARFLLFFSACIAAAKEQNTLQGLIGYLDAVKEQTGSYYKQEKGVNEGTVKLMSIHSAKGLEFPVVILGRMHTRFSTQDRQGAFLLQQTLGLAAEIVDEKNRIQKPTCVRELMKYVLERELKSEELRVLYVALTRAKEKLIFSAATDAPEKLFSAVAGKAEAELFEMSSMKRWMLAALGTLPCMTDWSETESPMESSLQIEHLLVREDGDVSARFAKTYKTLEEVIASAKDVRAPRFLQYFSQAAPAKIGVSALLPEDDLGISIPAYQPKQDGGAELGSLIHLFLQHIDLQVNSLQDIEATATGMVEKKLLRQTEASRILRFAPELLAFLESDLIMRAKQAQTLYRELPFSLAVPANEIGLAETTDRVLVQGIMDMLFLEEDGFVLVDYKSNMTTEAEMEKLAAHYEKQLELYRMAISKITKTPVKESWLWFVRLGEKFRVF